MAAEITPKYGSYITYRNRREYGRKSRLLAKRLQQLKRCIYPELIAKVVWRHIKPRARAHDPYARTGMLSCKVFIDNNSNK